jgi:hypothetical protein
VVIQIFTENSWGFIKFFGGSNGDIIIFLEQGRLFKFLGPWLFIEITFSDFLALLVLSCL